MQANQQPNNQPPAASQAMTKQADKQGSISRQTSKPPTKQEPTSQASQSRAKPTKPAKQAKFPKGTRAETVEYLEQEHYREDVEEEGLEAEARGVVFLDEDFGGVLREDGGELVLFR